MTDQPYTSDDLRAEAARQHAALTEDPDYMGIGEQLDDPPWNKLGDHAFDTNAALLADGWPEYAAAIALMQQPDGIERLKTIADGT